MNNNTESPRQTDHAPLHQIGPYRIEGELGAGGMGTVYLGVHQRTGERAAVKVLPASMAREPGFVARFNREIEAMRQLADANENIVQLYDNGEEHGTYYYAMEYVPGETLTARLVRERRLPWRTVIDIGTQICRALKAAHNAGVVHRDLKPSNLLIHEDGTVKLTDFGIAQVFATSKLTVTGGILGTAEYMSPEQAQGKRATKQSDIYSLGAVLYVMLTGRPPFTGKTTLEIAQKHKFSQFDAPRRIVPEIPHWLDEVVCKCLAKKPEERFPDAYVLGLRLQEIPRKVDMASSNVEFQVDQAAATRETEATGENVHPAGQVGGTFVRDMMRAQMDADAQKSPIGRLFDNPLVLIGMLVTLVVTTGWLYWNSRPSPEKLFTRGEQLMKMKPGPAWEAADVECFQPLLAIGDASWEPKVQPYLDQIRQYRFEKDLLGNPLNRIDLDDNEPNAILQRALALRTQGKREAARRDLEALLLILEGQSEFKVQRELAGRLLEDLNGTDPEKYSQRFEFLDAALERAVELDHEQGDGARQIREAIVNLYSDEPAATKYVEQARAELTAPVPSQSSQK